MPQSPPPQPQFSKSVQDKLFKKNDRLISILKEESSESYKELYALNEQLKQLSKTNTWIAK